MKWLTANSFQVTEDTPVREIRGFNKREIKAFFLIIEAALKKRRKDLERTAQNRIKDLEGDVKDGVISEEDFNNAKKAISSACGIAVRMISNYIETGLNVDNLMRATAQLSLEDNQDVEFKTFQLIYPDFDREREFEELTEGEANDILNAIRKFSTMSKEERDAFFSSSDSSAPNTGNGLAKNAASMDSTPSETVTKA